MSIANSEQQINDDLQTTSLWLLIAFVGDHPGAR
jgi:hypothetical protein